MNRTTTQVEGVLACMFHTQMEATACRVRARGLQAPTEPLVGRVPSRGAWECEMSGLDRYFETSPQAWLEKCGLD